MDLAALMKGGSGGHSSSDDGTADKPKGSAFGVLAKKLGGSEEDAKHLFKAMLREIADEEEGDEPDDHMDLGDLLKK